MVELYCSALVADGFDVQLLFCPTVDGDLLPAAGRYSLDRMGKAGVRLTPVACLRKRIPLDAVRSVAVASRDASLIVAFNQADRKIASVVGMLRPRLRVLFQVGNLHRFYGSAPTRTIKRRVYKFLVRRADLVVASSDAVANELATSFGVGPNMTVITNSIDVRGVSIPAEHLATATRGDLAITPQSVLALSAGRIQRQKGQDLLIEACDTHELDSLVTLVAGGLMSELEPKYCDAVVAQAQRQPNVRLLGWRDDIGSLLAASDFYVHPSRWDGFPLAVIEAMAAARPVVMSDCVGRPKGFLDGVHGFVVPAEDVPSLRDAMVAMANMGRSRLREMGRACRQLALEHYDAHDAGMQFCDEVRELAAR